MLPEVKLGKNLENYPNDDKLERRNNETKLKELRKL